jgi:hypothetical protein
MGQRKSSFLAAGFAMLAIAAPSALAATYHLDSRSGNDANDGLTEATAWKTLAKANATTFAPGSQLLLKAGSSWTGQLHPKGAGAKGNPNRIGMYGTGAKPLIEANGAYSGVRLLNQPFWEISDLEITNKTTAWGDYHGIAIDGKDFGTIEHTYIRNCHIHDVHGVVAWIGNSNSNDPGVIDDAGWDASKHSGGIVFDVTTSNGTKTRFDDILIEGNVIQDCSFAGISIKQVQGSVGWGGRSSATDAKWYPHTNLVIRDNYLSQYNNDHGCNTIYVTNVRGGLIERNVCERSGVSAIELYFTDDIVVQENEVFKTIRRCNSADFNGLDADKGTTKTVFQRNYVHDNGDGILFCQFAFGDAVVRYNIVLNSTRHGFNLHSDARATSQVYNNVVYSKVASSSLANSSGGATTLNKATYVFRNNIFFAAVSGPSIAKGTNSSFDHNLYYGTSAVSGDAYAKTSNPLFVDPGTGGSGTKDGWAVSSLGGYKLKAGSPCINAGVSISGNGGFDFWSGALNQGAVDIGAHEYGANTRVFGPMPAQPSARSGALYGVDGRGLGRIRNGMSDRAPGSSLGILRPDAPAERAHGTSHLE